MINQRARTIEGKKLRRSILMDSAGQLFLNSINYDLPNVVEISKNAALAKGSFYNYFDSKEEIFFEIFKEQIKVWFYRFSSTKLNKEFIKFNFHSLNILIKKLYPFVCIYSIKHGLNENYFSSYQEILIEKLSADLQIPIKIANLKFIQSLSLVLGFNHAKEINIFNERHYQTIEESLDFIWK
jgi:hypothetical protein